MKLRTVCLLAALSIAAPFGSIASEKTGTEMLFDTGSLADIEAGSALSYSHTRSSVEQLPSRAIEDGQIVVAIREDDDVAFSEVTMQNGAQKRKLHRFPTDRGNPIFVTFLESSISSVTFATKGSPFYIRNRIKEAFASGGLVSQVSATVGDREVDATRIDYTPFTGDRNAAKMGAAIEALTITFVLSKSVPGDFISMTSEAAVDGKQYFVEEVRFLDAKLSPE